VSNQTQEGWAIAGELGLYTGWWQTRNDAIAAHVRDLRSVIDARRPRSNLTVEQAREWSACKKNGDRAVRVTITFTQPNAKVKK
jgi:hypothetical protein